MQWVCVDFADVVPEDRGLISIVGMGGREKDGVVDFGWGWEGLFGVGFQEGLDGLEGDFVDEEYVFAHFGLLLPIESLALQHLSDLCRFLRRPLLDHLPPLLLLHLHRLIIIPKPL